MVQREMGLRDPRTLSWFCFKRIISGDVIRYRYELGYAKIFRP
jgi:hypothetical protein